MYMFSVKTIISCQDRSTGFILQMGKLRSREKRQSLMEGELAGEVKSLNVTEPWQRCPYKQDQNQDVLAMGPPTPSSP